MRRTLSQCIIRSLGAAIIGMGAPGAAKSQAQVKFEPYSFKLADGSELAAERGTFWVPEQRGNPKSRRIAIGFIRFKSTNPSPGEPLVYLAGGPGGSGVATARGPRQQVFLALRAYGDVIALDQRGTGFSNHIEPCTAARPFDSAVTLTDASLTAYYRETLAECVAAWRKAGVAVEGYTTSESADDIEDLRSALGVSKISLWGISYGTQLTLETMRRHPRRISRAVLASVDGMDQNIKLPARVSASFARMETAMAKPGLRGLMRQVHDQFDREPQIFRMERDGTVVTFRMDSFPLRMMAGILPKNPDGIAQLAGAYGAIAAGKGDALAPQFYGHFLKEPLVMAGMPELIDLASGLSAARTREVKRQLSGSLLGDAINFPVSRLIGTVQGMDLGERYRKEVQSSIPTLVLSGDLDPRTPLEEQAVAIAGLKNRHQVIVRNGGHDLFEAHADIPRLMIDFFSGKPLAVTELVLPSPAPATKGARSESK